MNLDLGLCEGGTLYLRGGTVRQIIRYNVLRARAKARPTIRLGG
jgi:hypothetical protein